jgi:hypothetical protein
MPKSISLTKFIPPFTRSCLVAYVTEKVFKALYARDKSYRVQWLDAKTDLYGMRGSEPSKWDKAEALLKRVDKKQINDLGEYLSQLNY